MEALDIFYPERMADRILGERYVSVIQEQFDQDEARKINKKLAKNQFIYFLSQIHQVKKMGI